MKIGLDTNILIRYLMNDDEQQANIVEKFLEETLLKKQYLFVSSLVILEVCWVLASHFKLDRKYIIDLMLDLLELSILDIEYHNVLQKTFEYAKTNTFDLSDLLIGAIAQANKCQTTLTFDQKAAKSPFFELLH